MPSVYFISDLHFGHEKIVHFRDGFGSSSQEHDEELLKRINKTVKAKDKLFVLGDAAFNLRGIEYIKRINCKNKELIIGNHDHPEVFNVFERVHGFRRYKEFWLSHCPIHPEELRGKTNIHGHVHTKTVQDNRYRAVCVEQCNGYPFSIDEIRTN